MISFLEKTLNDILYNGCYKGDTPQRNTVSTKQKYTEKHIGRVLHSITRWTSEIETCTQQAAKDRRTCKRAHQPSL